MNKSNYKFKIGDKVIVQPKHEWSYSQHNNEIATVIDIDNYETETIIKIKYTNNDQFSYYEHKLKPTKSTKKKHQVFNI